MNLRSSHLLVIALVVFLVANSFGQEKPIRFGRNPAVSPDGKQICFSYQGNLWVVSSSGGVATRLTANDSVDLRPRWSPDGKWIAFNSDREGGSQVFVIPSVGGPAKQITFHSSPTTVCDWFRDNKSLLVTSTRDQRKASIYRLDLESGRFKLLIAENQKSIFPALSPDGKWVAFTYGALADTIRKGYHGAANYDIFIAPSDGTQPAKKLTDSEKNDMWPAWGSDNKTVYFSSERDGLATVWKQSLGGKPVKVATNPPDAVRNVTIGHDGGLLAYEADNEICTTPASGGPAHVLSIICRTDEKGPKTSYATITNNTVSEFALSPDGKRTAFVVRGDIFVVNNEKGGEAKRLTDTPLREREIEWAPDGKSIVFSSNRAGEYHLFSVNLATLETKQLTSGTSTDTHPRYSPDDNWILYLHGPQTSIHVIRANGADDHEFVPGPKLDEARWSPDGAWVSYEREDDVRTTDAWVVPVSDGKAGKPVNITDHPGMNNQPRFFADGSHLAFLSNRYRNRDIETINNRGRFAVYTLSLQKEKDKFDEDEDTAKVTPPPAKGEAKKVEVKFDFDEIEKRAKQITNFEEGVFSYSVSPDSKTILFVTNAMGQGDIWQVSADGGLVQRVTVSGEAPLTILWAPDSSKFYWLSGGSIKWMARGGPGAGMVGFTARMQVDRLEDYYAVFDEAWQVMNDTYYDKNFHGANWPAVKTHYRSMVPYVTVRSDFDYLITEMLAELNSSHTGYNSPGARPARATGYLGIWNDEDYAGPGVKISKLMPRSPATKAESLLKVGQYILEINGHDISAGATYDQAMTDQVGRTVNLTVNDKPSKEGSHVVQIKPISGAQWNALMYEKWIDERRAIAEKDSGGRVGYLHVADMGDGTRNRFERELFSIGMRKDAMVLDFRGNNGGDTHDSLLKILERTKHYFNMTPRTETSFPQPEHAWTKPIIVLMDEASLSDAEVFANGFKELKLGKIVGQPTMGWIIFTSGQQLIDGSFIRTPHIACTTMDGRDMELWGVPPDIRVELTPADYMAGKDTQLDRAVEEILKDPRLKK